MDGSLFTRWAIVFLIIFVLFFLLVPGYGGYAGGGAYGPGAGAYGPGAGAYGPGGVGVGAY